jgi:hypothetical protein
MQAMDLKAMLSRRGGKTLEFKRDLSSPEGVLRASSSYPGIDSSVGSTTGSSITSSPAIFTWR